MKPVVYTCITNQKDTLQPVVKDEVDYVCFSDRPFNHPIWEYRPIEALGQSDSRRVARRYKVLSHIYFPGRETIWVDGRVRLKVKPTELLKKYQGEICARPHPSRTCIYQEGEQVVRIGYEHKHIVEAQLKRYKEEGMLEGYGLHETGLLVREFSDKVRSFNNAWMAEIISGSKRDQLSFDYIRWFLNQEVQDIDRDVVTVLRHARKTNYNT